MDLFKNGFFLGNPRVGVDTRLAYIAFLVNNSLNKEFYKLENVFCKSLQFSQIQMTTPVLKIYIILYNGERG